MQNVEGFPQHVVVGDAASACRPAGARQQLAHGFVEATARAALGRIDRACSRRRSDSGAGEWCRPRTAWRTRGRRTARRAGSETDRDSTEGSSMGSGIVTRLVRRSSSQARRRRALGLDRANPASASAGNGIWKDPRGRGHYARKTAVRLLHRPARNRRRGRPACRTWLTTNARQSIAALANHAHSFDTSACHEEPVGHRPEYDGSRSRCRAQPCARPG